MKPLKFNDLIAGIAEQTGQSIPTTTAVLKLYYQQVRDVLSTLQHPRVQVANLGTFFIKPKRLQERLLSRQYTLNLMQGNSVRTNSQPEVEQDIQLLVGMSEKVQQERMHKQFFMNQKKSAPVSLTKNIIKIWKSRNEILEGITNSIFKKEDVEEIAEERITICRSNQCGHHDPDGSSPAAVVPGAESCGSCGCKLAWATRSLSYACPLGFWQQILNDTEDAALRSKLGLNDH